MAAEPLAVDNKTRLSEAEADQLLRFMRSHYSLENIQKFMTRLFGDNDSVSTGEMEIIDDKDFIMLILAAIRSGERNTNFKAQVGKGSFEINGYKVPQMVFSKKEK